MAKFQAQSIPAWPARRALLLVHGVGNYVAGDYEKLEAELKAALGEDEWDQTAVYEMFWDPISDWFQEKLGAADLVARLIGQLKLSFDKTVLGAAAAEGAGDVIWPVLLEEAREPLRDACIRQMQQIVRDGRSQGLDGPDMQLWICCHSLGCFHTYEALFQAATDKDSGLRPNKGLQWDVIMFASPVQMIASIANAIRDVVPKPGRLFSLKFPHLEIPGYRSPTIGFVPIARRMLSITGDLDPVGGHLFRRKLGWAYMDITGTDRHVHPQNLATLPKEANLAALITDSLAGGRKWTVQPDNPHDWVRYVKENGERIQQWWLA